MGLEMLGAPGPMGHHYANNDEVEICWVSTEYPRYLGAKGRVAYDLRPAAPGFVPVLMCVDGGSYLWEIDSQNIQPVRPPAPKAAPYDPDAAFWAWRRQPALPDCGFDALRLGAST